MGNLALNKPTKVSSYVMPYAPSRAVDGSIAPIQRWMCNTVPCWLQVDLERECWINRYVIKNMPTAGWTSPNYNISDFKLLGSLDGLNWFDLDVVTYNQLSTVDRAFLPVEVRYVRLYVASGLVGNPQIASIMELEVYEAPPTSPYLSNMTLSNGTLSPTFSKNTYSYTANVSYDTTSITVTPTGEDNYSTITVNGVAVQSGHPSQSINLNTGSNAITVHVTAGIGGATQDYSIDVTRASSPYLSNVTGIPMTPPQQFNKQVYSYTGTTTLSVIKVTPTAEDADATIMVNTTQVSSGQLIKVSLNNGSNRITIVVISKTGTDSRTYVFDVTRQ